MFQRAEAFAAHMPLADRCRHIAGLFEILWEHFLRKRHLLFDFRVENFLRYAVGPAGTVSGQVQAGRGFAGEDGGSRRGANRLGAISRSETHALRRKVVQVWRMVILAAIEVGVLK